MKPPAAAARGRRAGLYLRVSTDEQTVENQRAPLEQLAAARGLDVVATWEETASGVSAKRPALDALRAAARRRAVDVVLVWSLDRLGRSMANTMALVVELDRAGVALVSVRETWLDTGGPARELLVAVIAWVAQQEREQLVARTRAGIERARAAGTHIGRPHVYVNLERLFALHDAGHSVRRISGMLQIKRSTIARALLRPRPEKGVDALDP